MAITLQNSEKETIQEKEARQEGEGRERERSREAEEKKECDYCTTQGLLLSERPHVPAKTVGGTCVEPRTGAL